MLVALWLAIAGLAAAAAPELPSCVVLRPLVMAADKLPPGTAFPLAVGDDVVLLTAREVAENATELRLYDAFSTEACGAAEEGINVGGRVRVFTYQGNNGAELAAPQWSGRVPRVGDQVYVAARGAGQRVVAAEVSAVHPELLYAFAEPVAFTGGAGAPVFDDDGRVVGLHLSVEQGTVGTAALLTGLPEWLGLAAVERRRVLEQSSDDDFDVTLEPVAVLQPQATRWVNPRYPRSAKRAGAEASCTSKVTLDSTGAPETVVVSGCAQLFKEAVLKAIRKCRWEPPIPGGLQEVTVYSSFFPEGRGAAEEATTRVPSTPE